MSPTFNILVLQFKLEISTSKLPGLTGIQESLLDTVTNTRLELILSAVESIDHVLFSYCSILFTYA